MYWKRKGLMTVLNKKYTEAYFVFKKAYVSVYHDEHAFKIRKAPLDQIKVYTLVTKVYHSCSTMSLRTMSRFSV